MSATVQVGDVGALLVEFAARGITLALAPGGRVALTRRAGVPLTEADRERVRQAKPDLLARLATGAPVVRALAGVRNAVLHREALDLLRGLDDASVDGVWTSPPFNLADKIRGGNSVQTGVRRQYAADSGGSGRGDGHLLPEAEYQAQQRAVLTEIARVLRPSGVCFYSHKVRVKNGVSIHPRTWVEQVAPLRVLQEVVWHRGGSAQASPVRFYPAYEVILILTRIPGLRLHNPGRQSGGAGLTDVWNDVCHPPGETRADRGHPAAAPVELVSRCLVALPRRLHEVAEQEGRRLLVVDPYGGTGTTALAASQAGMDYLIGDSSAEYVNRAKARLATGDGASRRVAASAAATRLPMTPGGWEALLIDPPWAYQTRSEKGMRRAAARHYRTMSLDELAALPVERIAADRAVLFLWVTMPFLEHGLALLRRWGFSYSTVLQDWLKTNADGTPWMGTGHTVRANNELLLLARRGGGLPRIARDVPQALLAPRREHSRKPDEVYERIERLYGDVRRIELFSRTRRPGWESWGDETDRFPPRPERETLR
jgi:N6-adenosine-specific RNA methylase IME4